MNPTLQHRENNEKKMEAFDFNIFSKFSNSEFNILEKILYEPTLTDMTRKRRSCVGPTAIGSLQTLLRNRTIKYMYLLTERPRKPKALCEHHREHYPQ